MSTEGATVRATWLPHEDRERLRFGVAGRVRRAAFQEVESWREHISDAFVPLSPEPIGPGPFSSTLSGLQRGPLRLFRIEGTAQRVRRGRREIARSRGDAVYLNVQLSGTGEVRAGGAVRRTTAGTGALVLSEAPFELAFEDGFNQLCVAMPVAWLSERLGLPLGVVSSRSLNLLAGPGRVMKAALASLLERPDGPEAEAGVDLFAIALDHALRQGEPTAATEAGASPRSAELRRLIRRRLADETLSPAAAASEMGCSVRTVHAAAQSTGQSFGQLLLEARLAAAAVALASAPPDRGRVAAVAYACGFNDLSHFSRAFRRRFGAPPSAWRG